MTVCTGRRTERLNYNSGYTYRTAPVTPSFCSIAVDIRGTLNSIHNNDVYAMSYVVGRIFGVTLIDRIMYVVHDGSSTIRLYDKDTYRPLDIVINVTGMKDPHDIVVCRDDHQLYVADFNYCIWRVSAKNFSDQEKWLPAKFTTETPSVPPGRVMLRSQSTVDRFHVQRPSLTSGRAQLGSQSTTDWFHVEALSVTSRRLLVTSLDPPGLDEYSTTNRQLLRAVRFPVFVKTLYHGVETKRGTFVIAHRGTSQVKKQYAVRELIRFCYLLVMAIKVYYFQLHVINK